MDCITIKNDSTLNTAEPADAVLVWELTYELLVVTSLDA